MVEEKGSSGGKDSNHGPRRQTDAGPVFGNQKTKLVSWAGKKRDGGVGGR